MKSYKVSFISILIFISLITASCSEIGTNSETFIVSKVYVKNVRSYDYHLKPTSGLGTLIINSKKFYNLGDTLEIVSKKK